MELVDRYLKAVSLLLPKAQREDIVAELRDTILSRIEAREAALGRPLNETEIEAELHVLGHPLEVAARYRDGPQYVVGPALFPYYAFALKVALALQLAIAGIVFVAHLVSGDGNLGEALSVALRSAISGTITLVGMATIAALIIEHYQLKPGFMENWKVRDLPLLELGSWDFTALTDRMGHLGRVDPPSRRADWRRFRHLPNPLIFIAWGAVLGLWWIGALHFLGPEGEAAMRSPELGRFAGVDWPAVKAAVYLPVLAYSIGMIGAGALVFGWPRARRLHAAARLALAGLGLATLLILWFASPLTPVIAIANISDIIGRVSLLLTGYDPHMVEDIIALVFPLNALVGAQAVLMGLWEVIGPDPRYRDAEGVAS